MFPRPAPLPFFEATRPDPREDLALDEALLRQTDEEGGPGVLRLWERPDHCVVLGRANRLAKNVNGVACDAAGVPILRRSSGGGTVLLGPGALCWSLVLPVGPGGPGRAEGVPNDVGGVTAAIMHRLAETLGKQAPGIGVDGTSDLTIASQTGSRLKIGGNAQRWLKRAMLHHGTLLYDFDLPAIRRFLTAPERQPDYRADRAHGAFVANLPLSRPTHVNALKDAFGAADATPVIPFKRMTELLNERFADPAWHASR
ncbi:MAG: lipoate--protein ligase family protein [Planctomycetota bacterium]